MIIPIRKELFEFCKDIRAIERRLKWCGNYIFMSSATQVADMTLFNQILEEECESVDLDDDLLSEIQLKAGDFPNEKLAMLINVILLSSCVYGEPE